MKKKLIMLLFIVILLLMPTLKIQVSANNGVPYSTYTYSISQKRVIPTQDAYIPLALTYDIYGLALNNPRDITIDQNNDVYIADTGNKRVIKFSLADTTETPMVIGEGFLEEPTGVFVDEEFNLYVADFKKEEAYKYTYNVMTKEYTLAVTYRRPTNTPLFLDNENFQPSKILSDRGGNVYILLAGNINGIARFENNGSFFGYFGGNTVPATLDTILKTVLFNEQQRREWFRLIPSPVFNMAIDQKGLILTTTKTVQGYKKLNIANVTLSESVFGFIDVEDVYVGPYDNVFTISESGIIVEYSADGDVLFMFGGKDQFSQKGLFQIPSGIAVDSKNNLYVIDRGSNALQVFYPTDFSNTVHFALDLYQKGKYAESEEPWLEVLTQNSLFDLAHKGLGNAYFVSGNYDQALISFEIARDQQGYSNAYWEVRNLSLLANAQYYVIALFAFLFLYLVNLKVHFGKYIKRPFENFDQKMTKYRLYNELKFGLHLARHPFDGFYGIKKEAKASNLSAFIVLVLFYVAYIMSIYFTGFLFNNQIPSEINMFAQTVTIFIPFGLWVISNYLVCSIRDGEGKFSHVFQSSAYSLIPLIIALPILTIVSNYLTYNEGFVYEFGMGLAIGITVLYIILMVKEIHNYSVRSSISNILISIFTALMIMVVVLIVYILLREIVGLFTDIWMEVWSRA